MRYLTKRNRAILREMVSTDFKVRYQGSILGYLWSLLRPIFMFTILYVVFVYIFKLNKGIPHYPAFLFMGIVLWNFFLETTIIGMSAVVARGDLIRKISIPRYLVVMSTSASAVINLLLNLVVVFLFTLLNGVHPSVSWVLFPVLLLELFLLATAVAFFLSALYVKFRDVTYIWEVVTQAGFYGTPILYYVASAPEKFQKLLLLNPVAQIIEDSRHVVIDHNFIVGWHIMSFKYAVLPVVAVVIMSIVSVIYFKKQSKFFAENI